jgi:hypothetical protein
MNPRKINPSVNPVPFPKLVESACVTVMPMTMLTMGIKYKRIHQTGLPTIWSSTTRL